MATYLANSPLLLQLRNYADAPYAGPESELPAPSADFGELMSFDVMDPIDMPPLAQAIAPITAGQILTSALKPETCNTRFCGATPRKIRMDEVSCFTAQRQLQRCKRRCC